MQYDKVKVNEEVSRIFNIPVGEYQTKDLMCNFDNYEITNDGLLKVTTFGRDKWYEKNYKDIFENPCLVLPDTIIELIGDDFPDKRYHLHVVNMVIKEVTHEIQSPSYDDCCEIDCDKMYFIPSCFIQLHNLLVEIMNNENLYSKSIDELTNTSKSIIYPLLSTNGVNDVDIELTLDKISTNYHIVFKFIKRKE